MPRPRGNGPGKGPGWGGPPKGPGAPPFSGKPGPGRGHIDPERVEKRARMMKVLEEIAESGIQENARVAAANAVLDRIDGKPAQTQINATPDEAKKMGYVMIPHKPNG